VVKPAATTTDTSAARPFRTLTIATSSWVVRFRGS
jgi:hypothetical protein